MLIRIRRGWEIPERLATAEDVYLNRRKFLQTLGITGLSAFAVLAGCEHKAQSQSATVAPPPPIGLPTPARPPICIPLNAVSVSLSTDH